MAAAEAAPLVKVGGLADVVGGLSVNLASRGHDVSVAIPCYGMLHGYSAVRAARFVELPDPVFDRLGVHVRIGRVTTGGLAIYLVSVDRWFGGGTRSEAVYVDDPAAYVVFARACSLLALGGVWDYIPDVVHTHDWHAGLVAAYVRAGAAGSRPALVHTVHNMAYTGTFDAGVMTITGLPAEWFTWDRLEYYGGFSFLKAGMVCADITNTVSQTYARECRDPEYGGGLAGLVTYLQEQGRFEGITNGLDTVVFDPAHDTSLPATYDASSLSGRTVCRSVLEADLGLTSDRTSPIIGMVSRICEQKGHDLVAAAGPALIGLGTRLVVLGVGDPAMTAALRRLEHACPGRVAVRIGFDAYLANRIYAGCDMFLMPSRFEPCGLGQLIALRYGAVPVVRRTGGLADTIRDADEHPRTGNGFVFAEASPDGILEGVRRAVAAYRNRRRWRQLMMRGMREDHGWHRVAPAYEALYRRALELAGSSRGA